MHYYLKHCGGYVMMPVPFLFPGSTALDSEIFPVSQSYYKSKINFWLTPPPLYLNIFGQRVLTPWIWLEISWVNVKLENEPDLDRVGETGVNWWC